MSHRGLACRLAFVCSFLITLLASSASAGGPPWIGVEMPGDPTNPASRGAVLLVHAYSCGGPTTSAVSATAEGIVKGERKTLPLTLSPAGSTGVYAVAKQWPSEGAWVLTFSMSIGGEVSTLVTLGPNGGVESAEYYGRTSNAVVYATSVQVIGRKATAADIDATLRAAVDGERRPLPQATATGPSGLAAGGVGAAALALSVAGIAVARRRRQE